MIPKEIYLIEWSDEGWEATIWQPLPLDTIKDVYRIELDWRLLEKEGHLRGTGAVPSQDEGKSVE